MYPVKPRFDRQACVFITALFLALALAGPAAAGDRSHDDGLFLRLSVGGGSMSTSLSDDVDKLELSGPVADLNFAIGGMLAPNLALHATVFGWSASDPTLEINGVGGDELPADVTASTLGAGLTYYFMPANLYLSGSVGSGRMSLDMAGFDGKTDRGLMLDLTLGKEWWVGDNWGLGAAAGLQYLSFGEPGFTENWSGTSFTLRFTATMN